FQLRVILRDGPRQKTNQRFGAVQIVGGGDGREHFRVGRARHGQLRGEFVAEMAERGRFQAIRRQVRQVNKVVGRIEMFQRQIGCVPPAVGLSAEKGDALPRFGRLDKSGEVGGLRGQGQLIYQAVAFVVPGKTGGGAEEKNQSRSDRAG